MQEREGNIILFIDELHTVVGAGAGTTARWTPRNLLKPTLARGELHAIGATTLDEYRKYIEKDAALERRFQPVKIDEPSVEDTVSILRGLRERYEVHHGVRIHDAALVAAATLSDRYITDRFLPDKAIDLVDEAAARLRMEIDSRPAELDEVERRMMQLEIEREALRKESDRRSQERLADMEREIAEIGEQRDALQAQWTQEQDVINRRRDLKRADRADAHRDRDGGAGGGLRPRGGTEVRHADRTREANRRRGGANRPSRRQAHGQMLDGGSDAGGDRGGRLRLDGHPGHQPGGGRSGETDQHGGAAARAGRRAGRRRSARSRRRSAARAPA